MSSSRPLIVVTRTTPGVPSLPSFPQADIRVLGDGFPSREQLLAGVRGADAILSMYGDKIDTEVLDAAGKELKVVANHAVGFENIDLQACKARGVMVTNTPGAVTEGTADMAWLLTLAVARRLCEGDRFARSGAWKKHGLLAMGEFLGLDLTGKTILIVGAGRIGYATALRSKGWAMNVLYVARSRHIEFELAPVAATRVELDEGLAQADVVSLHTPLTAETRHLIDARRLALLKPTAILINTARGPVVDEAALASVLKAKKIFGAGLDVFEREPEIHPDLLALDNVTMAPHIGSGEERFRKMMTEMACANADTVLSGKEPPNRVA
jgi:glyoxylate reductase